MSFEIERITGRYIAQMPQLFRPLTLGERDSDMNRLLDDLAAKKNNVLSAAVAWVRPEPGFKAAAGWAVVERFKLRRPGLNIVSSFVAPEHRKQGVSTALCREVLTAFHEKHPLQTFTVPVEEVDFWKQFGMQMDLRKKWPGKIEG